MMKKWKIAVTLISTLSLIVAIFLLLNMQETHTTESAMPEVKEPYSITNTQEIEQLKNNADTINTCPIPDNDTMKIYLSNICETAPIINGEVKGNKAIVPDDAAQTAWLTLSADLDSDEGTTIIYGHVSHHNKKGALYNVHTMKAGDVVTVFDNNGIKQQWIVTELENYNKKSIPTDLSNPVKTGDRKLKIITCGGDFLGTHYEDNVVLTAVPL